ncbi:hypothetical protein [Hyalangium versicolor]|uniref:hypothetical protein n=1 Tax=Hyalangium versicolor TaxID=2861190 RepID=UPI001CCE7370|nr:hypothetical protein [Hyalangium versicolor]
MATLRRGLVDKVKKAAAKVSTRGVEVAAKAGTRGARALVETTVAAVKTVDKLQEKLGRRAPKVRTTEESMMGQKAAPASEPIQAAAPKAPAKVSRTTARAPKQDVIREQSLKDVVMKKAPATRSAVGASTKSRRVNTETQPVALREAGRKTMPGAAPKRSKAAAQAPGFKVKRGQKHRHTGR